MSRPGTAIWIGLGIDNAKHRQTLTEAALLGSAIAHGVSPELGIVSDGSTIYALFVHGLCWIHQERNLAKLTPCGGAEPSVGRGADDGVATLCRPEGVSLCADAGAGRGLARRVSMRWLAVRRCWPDRTRRCGGWLTRKRTSCAVLDRPDLPLHTNTVEHDSVIGRRNARSVRVPRRWAGVVAIRF